MFVHGVYTGVKTGRGTDVSQFLVRGKVQITAFACVRVCVCISFFTLPVFYSKRRWRWPDGLKRNKKKIRYSITQTRRQFQYPLPSDIEIIRAIRTDRRTL